MRKTPEQKWKDSIHELRKKCQKIMGISKTIRYAGVVNKYGRTLTGILRPGLKPLLKSEQAKNEFFIISMLMTLRSSQDKALGVFDYVWLKHKKVILLVLQKQNLTYYISIEPKTRAMEQIISKIKKIL